MSDIRDPLWEGSGEDADAAFVEVAERAVEVVLATAPDDATWLGDHRFDDRLPDLSDAGRAATLDAVHGLLADVDALDDLALGHENAVDLEILRSRLSASAFELADLRTPTWDPMVWNPGNAAYLLLARDVAPLGQRLDALAGRLSAVPGFLADARATLTSMPAVHVETAIGQLQGTIGLLGSEVDAALARLVDDADAGLVDPAVVSAARDRAVDALHEHLAWLTEALPAADRDPRLGAELYAAALWHTLDEAWSPDELLARAEAEVESLTATLESLAAQWLGIAVAGPDDVRRALAELADDAPVDDTTVLPLSREAYDALVRFSDEAGLVTVLDDPVAVVEMPEIHRGVAVAYCDAPGPLETAQVPTFFAVAPTPADWDAARVRSFYREYHGHQLHVLAAHEGVPGHVHQLAAARRASTPTRVRALWMSGPFVEGWAVFGEGLVAEAGYEGRGGDRGRLGFLLSRTKMLLRTALNAVLDVRVHTRGLSESEAMALLTGPGFQEDGEAAGKWRRALLTHGQLTTYFVGHTEVSRLDADVALARPAWTARQRHDAMLAHGSPGPRHLRALLDLPPA